MADYRTIYLISTTISAGYLKDLRDNISTDLYDELFLNEYTSFNHEVLPVDQSILILDVSSGGIKSINKFYKLIKESSAYVILFLMDNSSESSLSQLIELSHSGIIYSPFDSSKISFIIQSSLYRFNSFRRVENKLNLHIGECRENDKKLKEFDSIFQIYRLVDHEKDIDSLLRQAVPVISKAFHSRMSIRVSFNEQIYQTENFKVSSRKLSDVLINQEGFSGILEMYVKDEDLEKFSITIEELNIFSTIRSLLSKALEGHVFEEISRVNYEYSIIIYHLFRAFTNNKYSNIRELFNEAIGKIGDFLQPNSCFIITYQDIHMQKTNIYSTNPISISVKNEIETMLLSIFNRSLENVDDKAQFIERNGSSYIIIPFFKKNKISGFCILSYREEKKLTPFFNINSFNMLSEYLSLSLTSVENLDSIKSFQQAIEQSPSSIVITDLKGIITYVNPHFEKVTGYSLSEIKGQKPRILKSDLYERSFYQELWDQISSGNLWHGKFKNKCKDGSIIWESASISPMHNSAGKMFGYIAINEDITQQVKNEDHLKQINEKLISAQSSLVNEEKLASIGRLAAGVAHELNNPIGFINSNFRSIKRYISKFKELLEHEDFVISDKLKELYQVDFILEDLFEILDESDEGFGRIINIINSLRSFSRIDEDHKASFVNLNDLIKTTLVVARNEIKYSANLHLEYGDIPSVYCIAGEINQVLLNIIVNAAQAVKEENNKNLGNIYICTETDGKYVTCRIKDDGPGISDDDKQKIFDPFYTTKAVGKGTGLGLSISYDIIVTKHKGSLSILDAAEGGAEFVVTIPIGEENE